MQGKTETTLRDRCKSICDKMQMDAMMRQGSSVETLLEFVESERAKSADKSLEGTLPLILYFGTEQDREEFMVLMHAAKPNMISRKMP